MFSKLYSVIGRVLSMENEEEEEKKEIQINHPNIISFPFKGNSIFDKVF